jgi:hypothetical protein
MRAPTTWAQMALLLVAVRLLVPSLVQAVTENRRAVAIVTHLSTTSACAPDEPLLEWHGRLPTFPLSPYLQLVLASALNTDFVPPDLDEWQRDPRLFYWFAAQHAVKQGDYAGSLEMMGQAQAGSLLDAAGHMSGVAGKPECSIINWTLASELGYTRVPDGYVQNMVNQQQWRLVAEVYDRLLKYDPQRSEWRLLLGQAYMGLGETAVAQDVLAPILLYGTNEEVEAVNQLLSFDR